MTKIVDDPLKAMDKGYLTGVLFLDFKKAFDLVNHRFLLSKLTCYKFDNLSVQWFDSYLSQKSQKVVMDNIESSSSDIHFGIPQESILGLLLFLLYINDLPLHLENGSSDLYADDTTVHFSSKSASDINCKLNIDMLRIHEWCVKNDMVINTNKSKSMLIGSNQRLANLDHTINIIYSNSALECVVTKGRTRFIL